MEHKYRDDYYLVWHDEFDQETIDESKWNIAHGNWTVNNEAQRYTNGLNYEIKDSCLALIAKKEPMDGKEYTSARFNSKGKGDFLYGRVEFRAKLPRGRGTWPALWMLGSSNEYGGWPKCGEIDIMEHVGYNEDVINHWFHTGSRNHVLGTQRGTRLTVDGVCDQFHVYAIEWFEDHIDIFVNDILTYSLKRNDGDTPMEWPFDKPHYIILNLAIGGNWGGAKGIDDSIFPCAMLVDYVRVYDMSRDAKGNPRKPKVRINYDFQREGL